MLECVRFVLFLLSSLFTLSFVFGPISDFLFSFPFLLAPFFAPQGGGRGTRFSITGDCMNSPTALYVKLTHCYSRFAQPCRTAAQLLYEVYTRETYRSSGEPVAKRLAVFEEEGREEGRTGIVVSESGDLIFGGVCHGGL